MRDRIKAQLAQLRGAARPLEGTLAGGRVHRVPAADGALERRRPAHQRRAAPSIGESVQASGTTCRAAEDGIAASTSRIGQALSSARHDPDHEHRRTERTRPVDEIRVTFGELDRRPAERRPARATAIQGRLDDLKRQFAPLVADWTGAAAEQYQARQHEIDTAMADLHRCSARSAARLGTAEQLYQRDRAAERDALRLSRRRGWVAGAREAPRNLDSRCAVNVPRARGTAVRAPRDVPQTSMTVTR